MAYPSRSLKRDASEDGSEVKSQQTKYVRTSILQQTIRSPQYQFETTLNEDDSGKQAHGFKSSGEEESLSQSQPSVSHPAHSYLLYDVDSSQQSPSTPPPFEKPGDRLRLRHEEKALSLPSPSPPPVAEGSEHLYLTHEGNLVSLPSPSPAPKARRGEHLYLTHDDKLISRPRSPAHNHNNSEFSYSDPASDDTLESDHPRSDSTCSFYAAATPSNSDKSQDEGLIELPKGASENGSLNTSEDEEDPKDHSSDIMSADGVRHLLERNFTYLNGNHAKKLGANIIERAMAILQSKRVSDWQGPKAERICEEIHELKGLNETSFLIELMMLIKEPERTVIISDSPHNESSSTNVEEKTQWVNKAWKKDHLLQEWNQDLAPHAIPRLEVGNDAYLSKLIEDVPTLTRPRPDVAWSINASAFDDKTKEIFTHLSCQLAGRNGFHTFCCLECKGFDQPILGCTCQAMRSGVAMVNNYRKFTTAMAASKAEPEILREPAPSSDVEPPSAPGPATQTTDVTNNDPPLIQGVPDVDSFAFTIAVSPQLVEIYVNWALDCDNGMVRYYAHTLRAYPLTDADSIAQLHKAMDNILDWGIKTRRKVVQKVANDCIWGGKTPWITKNAKRSVDRGADRGVSLHKRSPEKR